MTGGNYRDWHWERVLRTLETQMRAAGVGFSFPYMDMRILEYLSGLPMRDFVSKSGQQRRILREVAAGVVPREVARSQKSGLVDDLIEYHLGSLEFDRFHSLFESSVLGDMGIIHPRKFQAAYEAYAAASKRRHRDEAKLGSFDVWRTISAEMWLRQINGCCSV
jgi:hypothetical protein